MRRWRSHRSSSSPRAPRVAHRARAEAIELVGLQRERTLRLGALAPHRVHLRAHAVVLRRERRALHAKALDLVAEGRLALGEVARHRRVEPRGTDHCGGRF